MSENSKKNLISFRLSDDNIEKLEMLADTYRLAKSTMAANIVENALNDNTREFEINHICYPRPIIKKLFTDLNEQQIILMIMTTNEYNKEIIESTKSYCSPIKILSGLKQTWKKYGCETRETKLDNTTVIEIHHELDRNWSKITSATTSFILELLGYKIKNTFVTDNWFKIEYDNM